MQIIVKNLSHIYEKNTSTEFQALSNVNVNLNQGDFIAIIGHTGSGKTTFIEHLNALIKPTSGEVIINLGQKNDKENIRVIKNSRRKIKKIKEIRSKVGVVFQFAEYQLFEETIMKDIIFGPISMGVKKEQAKELAKKYIKLVGMNESFLEKSPFELSGGQKRRVALAGILSMEPDFLVFDEPTAGLDPQGEKDMYEIFKNLNKLGKTIIIVTHNLDHVLEHTSRTLMFENGQLIRDEKTLNLMYEIDFLKKHGLEAPKLSSLVNELEKRGMIIGKVHSIEELSIKIKEK